MNLPNKLTILRICMIPLFIAAYFLPSDWGGAYIAVAIFVLAAFTDFLDGYIARKYNMVTDLGKLLDPIADKILVTSALFCVVATNPLQSLSIFYDFDFVTFGTIFLVCGATLILARELLISAVRMIAASKGIVVQANIFGKVKTVLQDVALPCLVVLNGLYLSYSNKVTTMEVVASAERNAIIAFGIIGIVLFGLATVMTVVSGIIYLVQNKSVFVCNAEDKSE